jgi:hypothetical protein
MNSQVMNNVFLVKSQKKYNPDINQRKNELEKVRKENIFKKNTVVYNSITNQIPENIKSPRDLELEKDAAINNIDKLIEKKKEERCALEEEFKQNNPKQKMIMTNKINNTKIATFNEMKEIQSEYAMTHTKKVETNKNKYDGIMKNLKDLGIINN